jgi:hypothetical protein
VRFSKAKGKHGNEVPTNMFIIWTGAQNLQGSKSTGTPVVSKAFGLNGGKYKTLKTLLFILQIIEPKFYQLNM